MILSWTLLESTDISSPTAISFIKQIIAILVSANLLSLNMPMTPLTIIIIKVSRILRILITPNINLNHQNYNSESDNTVFFLLLTLLLFPFIYMVMLLLLFSCRIVSYSYYSSTVVDYIVSYGVNISI